MSAEFRFIFMSKQKCAHFHLDHFDKRITMTWQTSPSSNDKILAVLMIELNII